MTLADFDLTLTAWATVTLVLVTLGALIAGWRAATAANATFRLEAEPRLVVRVVNESLIFAGQGLYRLKPNPMPGMPATAERFEPLDNAPVYLLDGKPGHDGLRKIINGFAIRPVSNDELNRMQQAPIWPALRLEVRNVGRSPAVQVGLKWDITAPMFNPDLKERFEQGIEVIKKHDEATIIVNAVAPNDSIYIWLGNATGSHFTVTLKSPGYQRDPFDLDSGKLKPISTVAVSTFMLGPSETSISIQPPIQ